MPTDTNERRFTLLVRWIWGCICVRQCSCLHLSQGHKSKAAAYYSTGWLWGCGLAYLRNQVGDDLELGSTSNYARATLFYHNSYLSRVLPLKGILNGKEGAHLIFLTERAII